MREVQLYIKAAGESNYTKVELFDDETISLTQTIKNAQDVSKVFTDYSRSFTVPASKSNNKIFKHYYNFSIDNGFDARKRVDARIEINSIPFKSGRIRLDGVELKDDKAYAYKLTFFGSTIKLKDAFGEDDLSVLDLSQYNATYSAADLKTALQADPTTDDVVVPLITHSQRLTYGTGGIANSGDLKYNGVVTHGLYWSQLKYAIRVDAVVQAIADRYGFTISDDSFFKNTNPNYYNLFLWLHRKKGDLQSEILQSPVEAQVIGFDGPVDDGFSAAYRNEDRSEIVIVSSRYLTSFSLQVNNPASITYDVSIYRDGQLRISRQGVSSTSLFIDALSEARDSSTYEVFFSSSSSDNLEFTWTAVSQEPNNPVDYFVFNAIQGVLGDVPFVISQQIPEMKIIDFLSGLFKMFNLVAEVDEQNVLTVKTLDIFYGDGVFRDITRYIDNTSVTVDSAIPYAEIEYKYKSSKTILSDQFNQLTNREWGSDRYNTKDNLKEGGKFIVEMPFEHMQFERLTDVAGGNLTPIMYGYYVDDNQDPYIGAPLVFYPISNSLGSNSISYVTSKDANDNFNAAEEITGSINVPSNSRTLLGNNFEVDNIHFYPEANEYEVNKDFYKTLFYNYHYNYIASLFSFRKRMTTVKAILPVPILINYSLADTFVIQGNRYKINSINTNLNTGESTIQLLNDVVVAKDTYGEVEIPETLFASISGSTTVNEQTTHVYSSTVSGTATGLTTYEWSVGSGGTIVGSNTLSSVQVTWGEVSQTSTRSLTLTVRRNNDGNPVSFTTQPYLVTVQDSVAPPPATPLDVAIAESGIIPPSDQVAEGALKIYDAILYGDYDTPVTYTWSVDGGTITSGQGTDRVNVTWDTVTANYNGSIGLSVTSNDAQSDSVSYPVEIVDGTALFFDVEITGIISPVEQGFNTTYGVSINSNVTTSNPDLYSWSITGGTINTSPLGSTVDVTWDTVGTGQISVTVNRDGGFSDTDTENVEVLLIETTAQITGVTSPVLEGETATYGSIIGGNTTGDISYSWTASKGEISGGSYDGNGNSVLSGIGIDSVSVTWGLYDLGIGSISLIATRGGLSGDDSQSVDILPVYYIFDHCDGGETVIDRLGEVPSLDQRFADYSVNPIEYYVYNGNTTNSSAGFTVLGLQPVFEGGAITFGCPTPPPPPEESVTVTGPTSIAAAGETGVVYSIDVIYNSTGWQVTDAALSGFNPIDITFTTSTSGTGDGSVNATFGPYNGNGTETLRSVITATTDNVTPQVSGSVVVSQGPPPPTTYYIFDSCDPANSDVMVELASAPSLDQRAVGSFSNYYTYTGTTTTDPNLYPIASLTLEAATGCPEPATCTRYDALNEGNTDVNFIYTDCTSGGSRILTVSPLQSRNVCAVTGTFEYVSGNTNYTINELGAC